MADHDPHETPLADLGQTTHAINSTDVQEVLRMLRDETRIKPKWVDVAANGRVVIPANMRAALGISGGGRLIARINEQGSLVLETIDVVVKDVQSRMAPYIVPGVSVVDELIAERRAAAARGD